MKTKWILSMILFSSSAFASGDRVGNGGDGVACSDKTELLDFYESSLPLKSYKLEQSYKEITENVLSNLERFNPAQAKQYRRRFSEFFDETEFKSGASLINIKDSRHLFKPKDKNCKIMQIAIRRNEESVVMKRFLIDEDLWNKLSERSKAGLVLHEIIYEHFYKLGEDDSIKARAVNAYLFSEKSYQDGPDVYWKTVKDLKLPIYR